jgi:hypothetical protein
MHRPDFFIVGAPKCGTTALHEYLRQHPQIFMPERKELHYFVRDFESPFFYRHEAEYLDLFRGADGRKRIGESSVYYLFSKTAARDIKAFAPHARAIIMLRNPVDMMHSQHSQLLFNGNEDIGDFAAALAAWPDRARGHRVPPMAYNVAALDYKGTARFTEQVRRYFDVFGRERVYVILYDDFKADTAAAYRAALAFLDVDSTFAPTFEVVNPNKRTRSQAMRKALRQKPAPLRLAARLLPAPLRRSLKEGLERWNTVYEQRTPMDPDLRRTLTREFEGEVAALGELLGRDLSAWSRPPDRP